MNKSVIFVKGAREHNLKNIDVEIPRDRLVVITGLSGSGKSSLAFDTIYAEGQRRYVESLSAYARQFLGQMDKPDVDRIEGLSPAISIDQRTTSRNPRSTVGTVTEIYDYLRLLFARIGVPHCPQCGRVISQQTVEQIVDQIMRLPQDTRVQILAPVVRDRKGEYRRVFDEIRRDGFARVRVDGEVRDISESIELDRYKMHRIEIVVDRIVIRSGIESRLADSVEVALKHGDGIVVVDPIGHKEQVFSEKLACPECGVSFEELTPRMFSFNSPYGACEECTGLGGTRNVDPDLVLDLSRSINQGGILPWGNPQSTTYFSGLLHAIAEPHSIDLDTPLGGLTDHQRHILLYGSGERLYRVRYKDSRGRTREWQTRFEGIVNNLERRYRETQSDYAREEIEKFMSWRECPSCRGARLKPEVLAVTVSDRSIVDVTRMSVRECLRFFESIELTEKQQMIARQVMKEIRERLSFLINVGLDYLTLDRSAGTLSGGEAQRIRLATQIGSSLVGVLYILDEPSIGLHPRDNGRLIATLKGLRDLGNTVIVVEHDQETILSADHVVDIGPGAGEDGGRVVFSGPVDRLMQCEESVTAQYLSGKRSVPVPKVRRKGNGNYLVVKGASEHNLKNIDVEFPLGVFTVVTGVSGSGKSTLVNEILYKALAHRLNRAATKAGRHADIVGVDLLDKVINIDQAPIGRTPRSNPATYTGVFDPVRELFSLTPEARARGYAPGRFSFNVKGGRCEACRGDGIIKIEMHFLPDVYVPCEVCKGKRYNRETLEIRFRGKSIADVLDMTVSEALTFFENIPRVRRKLQVLDDVGLGYIRLGQPATTLSGGEAQRIKLGAELSKRSTGRTMYILDEPTTGLHFADVHRLLDVLNRLVDAGNTVIVIEHNLDVIKSADYVIDLGPEGGDEGGRVVATGTPEELSDCENTYTGIHLRKVLNAPGKR
ncbi:MAG: excinuclease ABC subunit UvrA [Firmicutes bacterium]|nr:excinuclease ABC subunit UvrA [Bacillota bacterium]